MSFYDRREADTEIESFKQTIKQLEEKLNNLEMNVKNYINRNMNMLKNRLHVCDFY